MESIIKKISNNPSLLSEVKDNVLPSIVSVITSLKERVNRLNMRVAESFDPAEEIAFDKELKATKDLLKFIEENQIKNYISSDLMVINTHGALEQKALLEKENLLKKMSNLSIITSKEIEDYNNCVHVYNLFCNVMESL